VPVPIERTRRGDFRLRLSAEERDVLRSLPGQLSDALAGEDPALHRLFPPAYPDDAARNEEYRRLVGGDLLAGKRAALDIVAATIDADRLDEEQVGAWLGAMNDLRLVLGTRLDVTEDPEDHPTDGPEAPAYALYHYLGWLVEQIVEVLAADIDPSGTEAVDG
jgi:hypothetical protein